MPQPTGSKWEIKASKTINKPGFCFVFVQKQMLGGSRTDRMSFLKHTGTQTNKHTNTQKHSTVKGNKGHVQGR